VRGARCGTATHEQLGGGGFGLDGMKGMTWKWATLGCEDGVG
jgi:hypothetical protein